MIKLTVIYGLPKVEEMEESLQSPEGMDTLRDMPNFATGGVMGMVGRLNGEEL